MKRIKIVVFSTIVVVIALSIFNKISLNKNKSAEIYTVLSTLKDFQSQQIEGKYFVLHFWAKWCAPCAEEMPHLVAFAKTMQEKIPQLEFLAVSLDETLEVSKQILPHSGKLLPQNFHLLLDPNHEVAETLGSFQYPETYFYGPSGKIIEKWVGPQKWDQLSVAEYFERNISQKL